MHRISVVMGLALCVGLAGAARADDELFEFAGFDYEDPDPGSGFLAVGDGYRCVGFITRFGDLLLPWVDPSVHEYTIEWSGLTVSTSEYFPPFLVVHFVNGARARCHEDPVAGGTGATYGVDPPNATAPSTFADGTLMLGGRLDNVTFVLDDNSHQGVCEGILDLDEGTHLVYVPPGVRAGWSLTFDLASGLPPQGFHRATIGRCAHFGDPTVRTTWGAIKTMYR